MFVNLTNHPVSKWSLEQKWAAGLLAGEVVCMAAYMPMVPPEASSYEVLLLATDLLKETLRKIGASDGCCLVQGECTLTHTMVNLLQKKGCLCLAATTNRESAEIVQLDGSVKKESVFRFVRFREYAKYE